MLAAAAHAIRPAQANSLRWVTVCDLQSIQQLVMGGRVGVQVKMW
jgi:hypothetical protein